MKTALCFTPDAAFFRPALFTAASLIAAGDSDAFDMFIVCQAEDVAQGFEALDPALRTKMQLLIVDFAPHIGALEGKGRFSRAVFRRLFLDRIVPERYQRIVYLDADMKIARAGLSQLATLDFGGKALAAGVDMIFYMDFRGDWLARRFQAYRAGLGLTPETLYFNTGLMAIDRAEWRRQRVTERALEAFAASPEGFAFMEQSALNKALAGDFAPLSPRFNFMGDFLLLRLEEELAPVVLHFVNRPKPWDFETYRGEVRHSRDYKAFFAASPWPQWPTPAAPKAAARPPAMTPARRRFREALLAFLATQSFADRDGAPPPLSQNA